jgi:hypothetical protein
MAKHGRGKPLKAKQIREAFNPVASLPSVNADFYRIADMLDERDRERVKRVRGFMEGGIAPIIEDYWGRDQQRHPAGEPCRPFVADAEAIYSYEGTRDMNTLIVGKAITGLSAFV